MNFPERVTVRQGTKLVFRQTWTSEPHTVTGGKLVDETIEASAPWLAFFLSDGLPPEDQAEPCTEAQQEQPVFDGTHSYYNSGIIPFEGQSGNTYEVPLSPDIEPGTYRFYCAVRGPLQRTEVGVVPQEAEAPSQEELSRTAREQIDEMAEPSLRAFRQATRDGFIESDGERIEGPFAGIFAPGAQSSAVNEFLPRQMRVRAGEPITWKMMGADHSISFDVPEYFPIMEFADDGTVRMNPRLQPPAVRLPPAPSDGGHGRGHRLSR